MTIYAARARRDDEPTCIYIAGRGHSGSTLLTLLLARHPKVAAVGELSLLSLQIARDESTKWVGRCSCGERPLECPVWGPPLREIEAENGVDLATDPFGWRVSDVGMEEEHRRRAPFRVTISSRSPNLSARRAISVGMVGL